MLHLFHVQILLIIHKTHTCTQCLLNQVNLLLQSNQTESNHQFMPRLKSQLPQKKSNPQPTPRIGESPHLLIVVVCCSAYNNVVTREMEVQYFIFRPSSSLLFLLSPLFSLYCPSLPHTHSCMLPPLLFPFLFIPPSHFYFFPFAVYSDLVPHLALYIYNRLLRRRLLFRQVIHSVHLQ